MAERHCNFDVFISYSSRDDQFSRAAKDILQLKGYRCWRAPEDLNPGQEWDAGITEAIEQCRVMVLVMTRDSAASDQVSRELVLAAQGDLIIIPLRLHAIDIPAKWKYYLAGTHWLEASDSPHADALTKLIEAVEHAVPPRAGGSGGSASALSADLLAFLERHDLMACAAALQQHEIRLRDLADLTDADLQSIGIVQLGVRKRFLKVVQRAKDAVRARSRDARPDVPPRAPAPAPPPPPPVVVTEPSVALRDVGECAVGTVDAGARPGRRRFPRTAVLVQAAASLLWFVLMGFWSTLPDESFRYASETQFLGMVASPLIGFVATCVWYLGAFSFAQFLLGKPSDWTACAAALRGSRSLGFMCSVLFGPVCVTAPVLGLLFAAGRLPFVDLGSRIVIATVLCAVWSSIGVAALCAPLRQLDGDTSVFGHLRAVLSGLKLPLGPHLVLLAVLWGGIAALLASMALPSPLWTFTGLPVMAGAVAWCHVRSISSPRSAPPAPNA